MPALRWSPLALAEIERHFRYISAERPFSALQVVNRIDAIATHLVDHPKLGVRGRVVGTRELFVSDIPYVLVYRLKADIIEIIHVYHTAQDR